MRKEHSVGSIFIGKRDQIVYTIVKVDYYQDGKVFGYKVYRSDKNGIDTINNWWLDDYAEKVQ